MARYMASSRSSIGHSGPNQTAVARRLVFLSPPATIGHMPSGGKVDVRASVTQSNRRPNTCKYTPHCCCCCSAAAADTGAQTRDTPKSTYNRLKLAVTNGFRT